MARPGLGYAQPSAVRNLAFFQSLPPAPEFADLAPADQVIVEVLWTLEKVWRYCGLEATAKQIADVLRQRGKGRGLSRETINEARLRLTDREERPAPDAATGRRRKRRDLGTGWIRVHWTGRRGGGRAPGRMQLGPRFRRAVAALQAGASRWWSKLPRRQSTLEGVPLPTSGGPPISKVSLSEGRMGHACGPPRPPPATAATASTGHGSLEGATRRANVAALRDERGRPTLHGRIHATTMALTGDERACGFCFDLPT